MIKEQMPESVMGKPHDAELNVTNLAEALYEGTAHLQNLAEKLARQHGGAGALSFFHMMDDATQNFYRVIAKLLIDHATEWKGNDGCACVLSHKERDVLSKLPKVYGNAFDPKIGVVELAGERK